MAFLDSFPEYLNDFLGPGWKERWVAEGAYGAAIVRYAETHGLSADFYYPQGDFSPLDDTPGQMLVKITSPDPADIFREVGRGIKRLSQKETLPAVGAWGNFSAPIEAALQPGGTADGVARDYRLPTVASDVTLRFLIDLDSGLFAQAACMEIIRLFGDVPEEGAFHVGEHVARGLENQQFIEATIKNRCKALSQMARKMEMFRDKFDWVPTLSILPVNDVDMQKMTMPLWLSGAPLFEAGAIATLRRRVANDPTCVQTMSEQAFSPPKVTAAGPGFIV